MPTTVATLQAELLEECKPIASIVGLDVETVEGIATSLAGPIRKAIIAGGGTVSDPPNVTDADVATASAGFDSLALYGKFFLLKKCRSRWHLVDMKSGEESQMLNQLSTRLKELENEIKEDLKDPDAIENVKVAGPPSIGIIEAGRTRIYDPFSI